MYAGDGKEEQTDHTHKKPRTHSRVPDQVPDRPIALAPVVVAAPALVVLVGKLRPLDLGEQVLAHRVPFPVLPKPMPVAPLPYELPPPQLRPDDLLPRVAAVRLLPHREGQLLLAQLRRAVLLQVAPEALVTVHRLLTRPLLWLLLAEEHRLGAHALRQVALLLARWLLVAALGCRVAADVQRHAPQWLLLLLPLPAALLLAGLLEAK